MTIFPAIDIRGGRVVRLFQGDYGRETEFSLTPAEAAASFRAAGAEWIHAVDLDGAKCGDTVNFDVVKSLIDTSGLKIEIGGGVRDAATVEKYVKAGASRIILGTAALRNPEFAAEMISLYGERIAIGVDSREGKVATSGWLETSEVETVDFCRRLRAAGAKTVIYTDISRDGMMCGPDTETYRELVKIDGLDTVASGGIRGCDDLRELREIGVAGAIIGRALYNGTLELGDALAAARGEC